ncbi:MAG: YvcK family protein [Candidatus Omnitrophota bacterium]|nr:YvcK family protein [Candidatus Omnitrophota bacterium]
MNKIIKAIRWLYPGLKIKRWIGLLLLGMLLILVSSHLVVREKSQTIQIIYKALLNVGIGTLIIGTYYLIKSFFEAIYPDDDKNLLDIIYAKRFLSKGPKIVVVGGGTGLSTVLNGLKEYTTNIVAIVTVSDEGGSSGRLREEFGILPPGDIRNCLVSLAEAPKLMRDLFQYRFKEGEGLKEHSFGNLFITAMTQVTGSFEEAIKASSKVLAIRGKVIPSTLDKIRLKAEYSDGTIKEGEDKITAAGKSIKRICLTPVSVCPNPEAIEAIRGAEVIILGPGSLFTSVIPNLLIGQMPDEIAKRNVLKLYMCNVMTQHGETDGFTAADHLQALITHAKRNIVNSCLVNSGHLDYNLLFRYAQDKSFPVIFDRERLKKMVALVFEGNIVSVSDYLHHDSDKTAKIIIDMYHYYKKRWKG